MIGWLFNEMVSIQREIYLGFGDRIKLYAETGDWSLLAVFLPMGILFGAVHAATPGHSKTVLAVYTAGTPGSTWQAVRMALILSTVHVSMSVIIVLMSLPLVSVALGSAGQSPVLEDISRGLIGLIGVWMIWSALKARSRMPHEARSGLFAVFAGLIPCPLTLFVMTFAVTRGVTEAGLAFAIVMLIGVAIVLGTVASVAALARNGLSTMIQRHNRAFVVTTMVVQFATGALLLLAALNELLWS